MTGGAVRGVIALCGETGRTFRLDADAVINATGVWTSQIEQLADRVRNPPAGPAPASVRRRGFTCWCHGIASTCSAA